MDDSLQHLLHPEIMGDLLTELCSICYAHPPKYSCPRCGCRTCGLECVKRHKRRGCSGVRDPGAYKKRSDLVTPASIDQDYNFIAKVQRDIERAEDEISDRGITPNSAKDGRGASLGKSKLDIELEQCGVTMIKAPQGLSRNKSNKTHWDSRHKCIMWTVEWVLQNDRRVVANAQGVKSILEAFNNAIGRKGLPRKRKLENAALGDEEPEEARSHEYPKAKMIEIRTEVADETKPKESGGPEKQETSAFSLQTRGPDMTGAYFYLHRPKTASKWICLIPISPETSISNALDGRTILEFPTIYAKHDAPDELQSPFITEEEYEKRHCTDTAVNLPTYGQAAVAADKGTALRGGIDEPKVMEELQKDLVG